jgi:hypothetical protein
MDAPFRLACYAAMLFLACGGYWLILFVLWRGATALGRAFLVALLALGGYAAMRSGIEVAAAVDELLDGGATP